MNIKFVRFLAAIINLIFLFMCLLQVFNNFVTKIFGMYGVKVIVILLIISTVTNILLNFTSSQPSEDI